MSILFINGSPNKDGNTVALSNRKRLLFLMPSIFKGFRHASGGLSSSVMLLMWKKL